MAVFWLESLAWRGPLAKSGSIGFPGRSQAEAMRMPSVAPECSFSTTS